MPQYVAIIDAGSTSSRILIYKYEAVPPAERYTKPMVLDKFAETESKHVQRRLLYKFNEYLAEGDISSVEPDVEAMRDHISPLLNFGVQKLPLGLAQQTVPLYIMATAGMRDDNGEGGVESRVTMRRAWDAIHGLRQGVGGVGRAVYDIGIGIDDNIPNNVRVNAIRDRYSFVIPAKDEGVYAWIALNYGLNRPDSWMPGVLELGGKSMQVAYADATDASGKAVCLWKSRYYVTSQSWVLGAEKSRVGAVEDKLILAAERLPGNYIYNPCLPSFQRSKLGEGHTGIGTGDFAKCLAMAESYLNAKLGTDSLSSLDIQHLATRFYGVSSFWYTYRFFARLEVYKKDSTYNPRLFKQAVEEYCTSSWLKPFPWIQTLEGSEFDHIHKHCFAAAWMITLFHDRKGFQLQLSEQEAWNLVYFPTERKVADRSSWTLGAAVMAVRHGRAQTFCGANEEFDEYPPNPVDLTYNRTANFSIPSSPTHGSSISSTPVVVSQPISSLVVESAQPIRAPGIPTAIAGSLLPILPFDALNPGSTFSVGLVSGVLLIALVLIGYRRFSTRRVAVQLPVSEDKHAVEVDDQPVVVRTRRVFFDKAKGAIFFAGGDNTSYA